MSRKRIGVSVYFFLVFVLVLAVSSALAQAPGNQVAKGPTPKASASNSTTKASTPSLVDLNSASKQTLMTLPGINDANARKIIENRPYRSKADLTQKKVISPDAYAKIEARIVAKTSTRVSPGNAEKKAASSKGAEEVKKKEQ